MTKGKEEFIIERVQTGVRLEKRLLKVLKAFAELHDLTLGDLLEGIVLHAFDGKPPFSEDSRQRLKELKSFYGLDLDSRASHQLTETKLPGSRNKDESGLTRPQPRRSRKNSDVRKESKQ
jgi:hypothetical protein